MRKYILGLLAALFTAIAWRVSHITNALIRVNLPVEYFAATSGPKDATNHCHVLRSPDNTLSSCEDQTFWDFKDAQGNLVDRKVIASCDPSRRNWNTVMGPMSEPNPRGALWLVNFDGGEESAQMLTLQDFPERKDFHPLGVRIWPSKSGSTSNMFVVNHGRDKTTIEQFVLDPVDTTNAKYLRTISSRNFISPNALALTSPTSFFVSNDHLLTLRLPSFLGEILPVLETFSGLPLGFISHVSIVNDAIPGAAVIRHTIPKLGIPFPNGIALSPDGRTLAVASSSYTRVHFFNRTQKADGTESLSPLHRVSVPFAPDNVHYADDGSLIVAGHPYFPGLIAYAENKTEERAPSWVVALYPRGEGEPKSSDFDSDAPFSAARRIRSAASHKIETLYQGDGTKFAESTTGLVDSRTGALFVTGLFQEGLLVCRP